MSNELATVTPATIANADAGTTYCSIQAQPSDRDAATKVYNALNDPDHRINDFINKDIMVTDVLIEMVELANEDTGIVDKCPRVVLIDENGESYVSVSVGMLNSVKNAMLCFGEAPWTPALVFSIVQKPTKNGSMLTAKVHG